MVRIYISDVIDAPVEKVWGLMTALASTPSGSKCFSGRSKKRVQPGASLEQRAAPPTAPVRPRL
jgi:hypothetical protein